MVYDFILLSVMSPHVNITDNTKNNPRRVPPPSGDMYLHNALVSVLSKPCFHGVCSKMKNKILFAQIPDLELDRR